MWVDAHLHLHDPAFDADRDAVIERGVAAGVGCMVSAGTSVETSLRAVELAERCASVWAAVGVHPASAGTVALSGLERLRELLGHPRVVAVGEIGLDYVRAGTPRSVQVDFFRAQVRLAQQEGLPVVVHNRAADEDVERILREEGATRVLLHCFTGSGDLAERWAAMGWVLSFAGPLTFATAETIREAARRAPAEAFLVETDAPYLAPVPARGRRCEPAHLLNTARALAAVRRVSLESLEGQVEATARRVFAPRLS